MRSRSVPSKRSSKNPSRILSSPYSLKTPQARTHVEPISLASRFSVEPHVLAKAEENEISEAIKPGGIHKVKAYDKRSL